MKKYYRICWVCFAILSVASPARVTQAQEFNLDGQNGVTQSDAALFKKGWIDGTFDPDAPFRFINNWAVFGKSEFAPGEKKSPLSAAGQKAAASAEIGIDLLPGNPMTTGATVTDLDSDIDTALPAGLLRGQRFPTVVRINNVDNLLGTRFNVTFDPKVLEVVNVFETPFDLNLDGATGPEEVSYYNMVFNQTFLNGGGLPDFPFIINDPQFGTFSFLPHPLIDTAAFNGSLDFLEAVGGRDLFSMADMGAGIPFWTRILADFSAPHESLEFYRPLSQANPMGSLSDCTTVLLPRTDILDGQGYDTSVFGSAILFWIDFRVREDAPLGRTDLRVSNAVILEETFSMIPLDLVPVGTQLVSSVTITPGSPAATSQQSVWVDLDRTAPGIQYVLEIPDGSGIPPTVQGAVVLEGTPTDDISYYSVQVEAKNLVRGVGGINPSDLTRLIKGEVADAPIGGVTVSTPNRFGKASPFGSLTPVGPDNFLTLYSFDAPLNLSLGETVEFEPIAGTGVDGAFVGGEPRRYGTGSQNDLITRPSMVRLGSASGGLDIPTQLIAFPGSNSILLHWTPASDNSNTGYNVYRADTISGTPVLIAQGHPKPQYLDPDLTNGEDYFYEVATAGLPGVESLHSERVGAVAGQVEMNLPEFLVAPPGSANVRVPVGILNGRGISDSTFEIRLAFPDELLSFASVQNTILTQGFSLEAAQSATGEVLILGSRGLGDDLTGAGSLVDVIFEATPGAALGATGLISYVHVELRDSLGAPLLVDFSDTCELRIGTENQPGDIDGNGILNSSDIASAIRAALRGLRSPSILATCDLNGDGVVDSADIILLQRLQLGLPLNPINTKSARVKGGGGGGDFAMVLGDTVFSPRGSEKAVPVNVELPVGSATGVAALEMQMNYDPDLVDLVRVDSGDLTGNFDMFVDFKDLQQFFTPGVVRVIFSDIENTPPLSGKWCDVVFQDKMIAPDGSDSQVLPADGKLKQKFGEDMSWNGTVQTFEGLILFGQVTATPTATPPDSTSTPTPTSSPESTPTVTPESTATATFTMEESTPTNTLPGNAPTSTHTPTSTNTVAATATASPTVTATAEATATFTLNFSPTPTATVTLTPTATLTPYPTARHPGFDANNDGFIDALDLLLFMLDWKHQVVN